MDERTILNFFKKKKNENELSKRTKLNKKKINDQICHLANTKIKHGL